MTEKKYKLGVVLSGGAARGFAHVGVLKALQEHKLYPDIISGVSAGALVGSFYCDGYKPDEIIQLFGNRKWLKLLEFSYPRMGLTRYTGLARLLKSNLKSETFDDLKIPLVAGVTNLNNGKAEYISKGSLKKIVLASATIPGLVKPLVIDGSYYVDGGVMNNLPIKPIAGLCERIIAVHVNPTAHKDDFKNVIGIIERAFHLSVSRGVKLKVDNCDLFIEPPELKNYSVADITKGKEMNEIGYEYTMKLLEDKNTLKKFE
jgi:NTE family protein